LKNFDQKIVIKVRHPGVMNRLKQDLNLIFNISDSLSKIWGMGWIKIPLTKNELLKVLIEQADFRIEGNNLR
jgi:predicted unusual protein kinase regulating ubiquinone biosynthesis (AarF/ABC1/UbiB family)